MKLLAPDGSELNYRKTVTCQLVKGRKDGYLLPEAMDRACEAVTRLFNEALAYKPESVLIYATEAVRSAANGSYLLKKIKQATGIDADVIDGATEAFCAYLGALGFFPDLDCTLDVGGASTEIVRVESGVCQKHSFPFGAVQLTDLFGQNYGNLFDSACFALKELPCRADKKVIGTSGTFASIAVVAADMPIFSPEAVHGCELTKSVLHDVTEKIAPLSPERIHKLYPAIEIKRANVLKAGVAIVNAIMERTLARSVTVSSADGLVGYLVYKKLC